jgi:hypothetical protein
MLLFHFGLYISACLCILSVSILSTCCTTLVGIVLFTKQCSALQIFSLTDWFLSLPNSVIPNKCLKNLISAAYSLCSLLFFSTQTSLPNFKADLTVILRILNFVSLVTCFPKCLRIMPFILLHVCSVSSHLN